MTKSLEQHAKEISENYTVEQRAAAFDQALSLAARGYLESANENQGLDLDATLIIGLIARSQGFGGFIEIEKLNDGKFVFRFASDGLLKQHLMSIHDLLGMGIDGKHLSLMDENQIVKGRVVIGQG